MKEKIVFKRYNTVIHSYKYTNLKEYTWKNCHLYDEHGNVIETSISDASAVFDELIYLSQIIVDPEERGKGFGTACLQEFCKEYKDVPILLDAGYLAEKDYYEARQSGDWTYLDMLEKFYIKNGFTNVNNMYGCYDEKITMLNLNQ